MVGDRGSSVILAAGLCVGLIGGAIILGQSLQDIRRGDPYVTVKGAAERDVKADLAIWAIPIRIAGNDLEEVGRSLDATRTKVLGFLSEKGFTKEEITKQGLRVADRQAAEYSQGNMKELLRYVVATSIIVRTKDVDRVERVSQMTDELVRAGVVLSAQNDWQSGGPRYVFTQLNTIKPEMLAEATKTARASAMQFARDSGSTVGKIRRASQGLFSITDRDQTAPGQGEGGEGYAAGGETDPNKRVRVVVTVDYLLNR
jgi:hypothetical protein